MTKKMSKKEFVEILDKAGMYFDNWGFDGILNLISIALSQQAKEDEKKGGFACAKEEKRQSYIIYEELSKRGYYGDM